MATAEPIVYFLCVIWVNMFAYDHNVPQDLILFKTLSSMIFFEDTQPVGRRGAVNQRQNMWNLSQILSVLSSRQLLSQVVIRALDVMMTSTHFILWSIFSISRLLPLKSKGNRYTRIYFIEKGTETICDSSHFNLIMVWRSGDVIK